MTIITVKIIINIIVQTIKIIKLPKKIKSKSKTFLQNKTKLLKLSLLLLKQ
jgi:hypothetical protein